MIENLGIEKNSIPLIIATSFCEALWNSFCERVKIGIILRVQAFLFYEFPHSFNQVEVWWVRRQVQQFNVKQFLSLLNQFTLLISGIIQDNGNRKFAVFSGYFCQKRTDTVCIYVARVRNYNHLMTDGIECAKNIEALSSRWSFNEEPRKTPKIS